MFLKKLKIILKNTTLNISSLRIKKHIFYPINFLKCLLVDKTKLNHQNDTYLIIRLTRKREGRRVVDLEKVFF
jgi:hypothetical protein